MSHSSPIDRLHIAIRSNRWFQLFTACTRLLLAIGFIIPGLQKFEDRPFTIMPPSSGVWAEYFHVLYRTGYYYEFLGGCQVVAAVLLLIPATAHIGNLIYFPIILNIAILTNAIFGSLTPV
ncbi:MAG: DoxX family protein, partial [Bacteroidota bacterium]